MRVHRRALLAMTFVLAATGATIAPVSKALARGSQRAMVERIRYISTVSSWVLVDLSGPVQYHMEAVSADGSAAPPDRLVIDFAEAKIGPEAREPLVVRDDVLRGIRTGQYSSDTARIVLDLARSVDARVFVLSDPHRLIVDLTSKARAPRGATALQAAKPEPIAAPVDGVQASARASAPPTPVTGPPPALPPPEPPPRAAHTGRRVELAPEAAHPLRVVIDPGHGGKDPGARGVRGLTEKDVVLNVSKLLASRLREDGIEVFLTRRDDRFLSLEERTAFANSQGADLFISVHANASSNTALRGVEIYYLNNTDNRGTLRLAAMENNLHWDPHDPKSRARFPTSRTS